MNKMPYLLLALLCALPHNLWAHGATVLGFQSGISHPVLGLDHLLAMVSVGIISAQIGGRAIWTVPTTFVLVMALGGALGMANIGLIAIELGIALSVIILGIVIALSSAVPILPILAMVSFFAIFHGYAHGLEIPELALSWAYIAGFMLGTAWLHLVGVAIGMISNRVTNGPTILRYVGAGIAGIGLHILLGMWGL